MKNFFKKIDQWLIFSSPLSKTGLVFIFLSFFLTLIAFSKGIQVLMFVPAFILGLFAFSAWDYFLASRKISLVPNRKERVCTLYMPKNLYGYFFRIAVKENGIWKFLPLRKNHIQWTLPENSEEIQLLASGRLDIFQKKIPLPLHIRTFSLEISEAENEQIEVEISEYREGDDLSQIDAKKTALSDRIFLRKKNILTQKNDEAVQEKNMLEIFSAAEISAFSTQSTLKFGFLVEWALIFIGFIGVFLEWGGIIFSLLFCVSFFGIFFAFYIKKKSAFPQKYLNIVAVLLFSLSLGEGFLTLNTVLSGAHFLLMLAVWKHAFARERRDAFTYIFLILFVFIALSLYTLSAWFLFLFLSFLVLSGFLFSVFSGGEIPEEYSCRFGTPYSKSLFIKYFSFLLIATFVFFLVLPHGEAAKDTSALISAKSQAQTGFTDSVSLNSVGGIKQNFGKKIVIEKADPEKIGMYADLYWRGARFNFFDGKNWQKVPKSRAFFRSSFTRGGKTEAVSLKIYADGGKNIFLPFVPSHLKISGKQVFTVTGDKTIFETAESSPTALFLEVSFLLDRNNKWISPLEKPLPLPEHCKGNGKNTCIFSQAEEQLFAPFWEKIPLKIQNNPQKISEYIQSHFRYSLENPAKNMEDFLYGSQQGHCEYFASVLTITLQHFGFSSATLVNGFHGGSWNNQAGAWVVRNQNAHSWVEIYAPEKKRWIHLDPTPASSADLDKKWFQKNPISPFFIEVYDAIELRWNRFFVEFTGTKQKEFFFWVFSFWKYFLGGGLLILFSLFSYRYYKNIYEPYQKMSDREKFENFLETVVFKKNKKNKKNTQKGVLEMGKYEKQFPKLVQKTREILYKRSEKNAEECAKEISELKKSWRNAVLSYIENKEN